MIRFNLPALALGAVVLAAGCGKNPGTYTTAAVTAADTSGVEELVAQADAKFEGRIDPATLEEALELYAQVVAKDPTHRHALSRLVRGWYFHGDYHTDDKQTKIDRWATAIETGKQCLALNEDFASRIRGGEKEKDAVVATTVAEVPCLYWTASAIGKWGKIQGIAKALGNLPTVKAYIGRVEELQPEYFYFGPARYWGAYYSVLPSFAGQDLEKSEAYFEQSLAGAPGYLPTYGLRAENLAVKLGDVGMFRSDLKTILDADPAAIPDLEPENTLEQAKAKALMAIENELFDKKTLEAYESGGE